MQNLLWLFLNFGLGILMLIICIKAARHISKRYGIWAAIVFVFIILSSGGRSNTDMESIGLNKWNFASTDSIVPNSMAVISTDLEENLISKYSLGIQYGMDKNSNTKNPVIAWSNITGIVSGTSWIPFSITINETDEDQTFEYEVSGIVCWKLLGKDFYSQERTWKGLISLK